ncbi:MAG: hypothetical protein OES47_00620 [Acidobacteriota bacterium]|nr:hypothetical protein [Acidobacteriota bacterium]
MPEEHSPKASEYRPDNTEEGVDLGWVFSTVWQHRGPLAVTFAAFTLLFWTIAGLKGLLLEDHFVQHTKDIKLVFVGVDKDQYPDGTGYSASNIIAPVVLNEVYEANGLAEFEVPIDTFVNAFAVQAHAPQSEFIVRRYRGLLETRNLGVAEISTLEEHFSRELRQAARSGARITLTLEEGTLSDEQALKVLDDVPLAWQRHMIDRRGIFKLDAPFLSAHALDKALLQSADYLVLYDILRSRLDDVLGSAVALREMPNADNLVDTESGLGLADLESVLKDLRDLTLEQAATVATGFRLSRDVDRTARYFEKRIEDLQREQELLSDKSTLVAVALDKYTKPDRSRAAIEEGAYPEALGGTTIPQFGSDFLDRLVELGTSTVDLQFRQALSRERLDFGLQAADLESEVRRLRELVARLGARPKLPDARVLEEMNQQLEADLESAREVLVRLMGVLSRLRTELERFNYGTDRALFRDLGTEIEKSTSATVITSSNLRWYGVLTLLLVMALVVVVLVRAVLRERATDLV